MAKICAKINTNTVYLLHGASEIGPLEWVKDKRGKNVNRFQLFFTFKLNLSYELLKFELDCEIYNLLSIRLINFLQI